MNKEMEFELNTTFQSLIGRLKIPIPANTTKEVLKFQSLIGRLKIILLYLFFQEDICFNPL